MTVTKIWIPEITVSNEFLRVFIEKLNFLESSLKEISQSADKQRGFGLFLKVFLTP